MRGAGGGGRGGGTSLIFFFFFLRVKFYFYLPICDYLRVDRKFFEIRREVWRKTLATVWSPSFVHFGATSISIRSKFSSSSDGHVTSKLRVRQGRSFVVINLTEIRVSASASFFVFSSSLPHVFFFFFLSFRVFDISNDARIVGSGWTWIVQRGRGRRVEWGTKIERGKGRRRNRAACLSLRKLIND